MQITEKAGAAINTERLAKTSRALTAAAENLTKALGQIADAVVDTMNCIDWNALSEALAAVGCGSQEAETEPDDNPVRFIGIRKRGWKRGRRKHRC